MAKRHTANVTVDVDTDEIKRLVEMRLADKVSEQFDRVFDDIIRRKVTELVDDITRRQIEKAVTDALDEGWQSTNSYGEAIGPRVGLKGRIADMLSKTTGDYNNRMTQADKITKDVIDSAFRSEFGKEIKAAQENFKKAVDAEIAGRFTSTIKSALGLR